MRSASHETRLYVVLFSPIALITPSDPSTSLLENRNKLFFP